ncbi:MAG: hypothetical protein H6744_03865 [Deltaproteobacteria bacterium]|nr:hypothetical protein [Deltaproteobacteria bacterium]
MSILLGGGTRFQPITLEPGAPGAFACFGSWENIRTCQALQRGDDPLGGCSQAAECRSYTLERNPPTMRFTAKPRRDGRFEVQQFREFIADQETYELHIDAGQIAVTYPGDRKVPKSRRFFLHTKHVEQAQMSLDKPFELVVSLDKMIVRQAGAVEGAKERAVVRREEEDPAARRRRIAERLRQKASVDARTKDGDDDELGIDVDMDDDIDMSDIEDIDVDIDIDDDDDDDDDDDGGKG